MKRLRKARVSREAVAWDVRGWILGRLDIPDAVPFEERDAMIGEDCNGDGRQQQRRYGQTEPGTLRDDIFSFAHVLRIASVCKEVAVTSSRQIKSLRISETLSNEILRWDAETEAVETSLEDYMSMEWTVGVIGVFAWSISMSAGEGLRRGERSARERLSPTAAQA